MNATIQQTEGGTTTAVKGQKSPLSAIRLDAGESLFLGHPRPPESKMLIMGQHFDFVPPYRGRPGDQRRTMEAKITAKVPLLLAVRDADGEWARSVTHIRLARPGKAEFGIATADQVVDEYPLRAGAKAADYPEHLVVGGPSNCVLYGGEFAIPAYRGHGERILPFAYVVEEKDRDLLLASFRGNNRMERAVRMGDAPVVQGIKVSGVIAVRKLGEVTIHVDAAGVIRGIELDRGDGEVKARTHHRFQNGIEIRTGEIVKHPRLREALELTALPTVEEVILDTYRYIPPPRREASGNKVMAATPTASLLDKVKVVAAPPKAVPAAVRRTAAPKLSDVVVPTEEETPAAPEVEVTEAPEVTEIAPAPAEVVEVPTPENPPEEEVTTPEEEVSAPAELPVIDLPEPEVDPTPEEVDVYVQAVEAVIQLPAQPVSATAELLVEAFAGEQLPLLIGEDGISIFALPGASMTLELAAKLEGHFDTGGNLLMSPAIAGFITRFYEIYTLEHKLPDGDPDKLH